MRAQSGFSFLELIVVIGLIGVVAAFAISGSNDGMAPIYKVVGQAQEASVRLTTLISSARSAQTSIRISCDSKRLSASYYRLKPSNRLAGSLGTSVVTQTTGGATRVESLVDYSLSNMSMICPSGTSYVTSDGSIFTQTGRNFDLIISSSKKPSFQARVLLSKVGYPRIYARDTGVSSTWSEIRQ